MINNDSASISCPDEDDNGAFRSLGDLLMRRVSVGTLATAIEQGGIYTWDRFGRFGKALGADENEAFSLLERHHKWEIDPEPYRGAILLT